MSGSSRIRIVPLGGLGEIGMNCMAVEMDDAIVVVDCGVGFPSSPNGVDVLHPDFSYLEENRHRIAALLVTHGHEDHIGAIPYLLRRVDVPVYAPPYALGLIRARLEEVPVANPRLVPTAPRKPFTLHHGPRVLEVEPVRVTHSIADATALAIRSDAGMIVHTGDFKIDVDPTDGELFDQERLRAFGDDGVTLLLSDSTNADAPGTSRTERQVADALLRVVSSARERVVVGLFASNVHRLRALATIARQTNRRLALLGRSVQTHVRVATDTGYLRLPPDLLISIDHAADVPRRDLLVVATGSQAESRSALARLALDDHPRLRLEPGDTIVLSARAIPGNELAVQRMIGDFYRRGCVVHVKSTDPDIHTSGHAHRDEQRAMIDLVRPTALVPVHGTRHHMERHAALARDVGVRDVLVVENGEIVDVDGEGVRKSGAVRVGKIAVDAGGELTETVLKDRRLMAELGVATIVVMVDESGKPTRAPSIATRGVLDETVRWDVLADAQNEAREALETHAWTVERPSEDELKEVVRLAVRRVIARHVGRKPITIPLVIRDR